MGRYSLVISAVSMMFLMSVLHTAYAVTKVGNASELYNRLRAANNKLVVLEFCALSSTDSVAIGPHIEKLATEYPKVDFLRVNGYLNFDLYHEYKLKAIPTIVLLECCYEATRVEGKGVDVIMKALRGALVKDAETKNHEVVIVDPEIAQSVARYSTPRGLNLGLKFKPDNRIKVDCKAEGLGKYCVADKVSQKAKQTK